MIFSQFLSFLDILLGLCAVYLFVQFTYSKIRSNRPLPPGPKRLPLIGNLLDLPKGPEGPHWAKHKALYGKLALYTAEKYLEIDHE